MKTYIFDKSGIGVALSKESEVKSVLAGRVWKVYESGNSSETCRFTENCVFESNVEGEDLKGSWAFSPYDARLVVSCMGQFLNYNLVKLNDFVLILNEKGTDKCVFLVDEQNEELLSAGSFDEFIVLANKLCDVQHSDDSKVVGNQSASVENGNFTNDLDSSQDNYTPSFEMDYSEKPETDDDENEVIAEDDSLNDSTCDAESENINDEEVFDEENAEVDVEVENEYEEIEEDDSEEGNADDRDFGVILQKAKQGDVNAVYYVAVCYKTGTQVSKDEDKAYEYFEKAAEMGNDGAMIEVAREGLNRSHSSDDDAEAVKWYVKAADMGNSIALYELGQCYEFGVGCDVNEKEAKRCYVDSAKSGYAVAQHYLGSCFNKGNLFSMNGNQAFIWYEKAARQGHLDSIVCVADICRNTRSYKDAFEWYLEGAKMRSSHCMVEIARLYRYGYLGKTNIDQACSWYKKAFDNGFDHAKVEMEEMLAGPVAKNCNLPKVDDDELKKTKLSKKIIFAILVFAYMIFGRFHMLPLFFIILIFWGVAYVIKKSSKKED